MNRPRSDLFEMTGPFVSTQISHDLRTSRSSQSLMLAVLQLVPNAMYIRTSTAQISKWDVKVAKTSLHIEWYSQQRRNGYHLFSRWPQIRNSCVVRSRWSKCIPITQKEKKTNDAMGTLPFTVFSNSVIIHNKNVC